MKKIFLMFAAMSVLLAACEKEPASKPSVSFETAVPVLTEGVATLSIKVEKYTGTTPVTVPVTFSGSAVKGTDYTVSAEEFVIGGDKPVTKITVTQKTFDAGKNITAVLTVPEGFIAGTYPTSTFSLSGQVARCSFSAEPYFLYNKIRIPVSIFNAQGNAYKLQYADEIAVVVDESSTAVEGTNFKFVNDKKAATIAAGQSVGYVEIEAMTADENNRIVLKLDLNGKYGLGETDKVEITVCEPLSEALSGKWVINELVTDAQYFEDTYYFSYENTYEEQLGKFPKFEATDSFEFDSETGVFAPSFNSDFKNYFIGDSYLESAGDMTLMIDYTNSEIIQIYNFNNVNRNFSATSSSEDTNCLVGIVLRQNPELLDMYIIDYVPTDFLTSFVEYGMVDPSVRPSSATVMNGATVIGSGIAINLTFKRATE